MDSYYKLRQLFYYKVRHGLLQGVSKVRSDCKLYYILRKAFNASLGKCKLIHVRNLSK